MPYCLKCGSDVGEAMAFCPSCGAALKTTNPNPAETQSQEQEKQEQPKNSPTVETHDRNPNGVINYLIAGLILVLVGGFGILDLTSNFPASGPDITVVLILIGAIIISGAVYVHVPLEKYFQRLINRPKKNPQSSTTLKT